MQTTAAQLRCKIYHQYQHYSQPFTLDVDLSLTLGGITAIFGHSGAGKSRLLRCIAGLEQARQALISFDGCSWQQANQFMPAYQRPIGYVFQEPSLFDHLTVKANLAYAQKRAKTQTDQESYQRILTILAIEPLLNKSPWQLSGGEKQRVAIARALLTQPQLLLMDEPLAALDIKRKQEILPYLKTLTEQLNIPLLYVSHSTEEIAQLADHLVVLEHGKVVQQGQVEQVLAQLDVPLQLEHGEGVLFQAPIADIDQQWQLASVMLDEQVLWLRNNHFTQGQTIRGRILARDVSISRNEHSDTSILNRLHARVIDIATTEDQAVAIVKLKLIEQIILARVTRKSVAQLALSVGDKVWLQIKSVALVR